jgi:hypothetical protein
VRRADAYDDAFSRCVTPWFVIAGGRSEVASTDKLLVIHTKEWVVSVEEVLTKYNLDPIM